MNLSVDADLLVSDPAELAAETISPPRRLSSLDSSWRLAYIAVGTNLGDRHNNLQQACLFLQDLSNSIINTSFIYSTPAAYVTDQPAFYNIVVSLTTDLCPLDLLAALKRGEQELGRVPSERWGPRHIDLDILTYGVHPSCGNVETGLVMRTEELSIPHVRMFEREFVLRPLCDLDPGFLPDLEAIRDSWDPDVTRIIPLPNGRMLPYGNETRLMGILNATPDSFTDGGNLGDGTAEALRLVGEWVGDEGCPPKTGIENGEFTYSHAKISRNKWTAIVDVGGQSTRPGADVVGTEEEIKRVVPIISAIRERYTDIVISVDTSIASVAEAAIGAGADIINDVTAGRGDKAMLQLAARLQVPIVLMHSRGTSKTMNSQNDYSKETGLIDGVYRELCRTVQSASNAGVRKWNIILDPGVGFAKIGVQNVELMRALPQLFSGKLEGYAVLVGPSRKRFLGTIAGHSKETDPTERDWGTAAAVTQCVNAKVDFVRVHNVSAMTDVVANANAFLRELPIVEAD
ncbi:hypothetical protein SARC_04226 [Sphaeroforma arctica JP610]|uniref:Pterin-binding domain-containing protein n=1 Tax=Sphaeroforma arctica JP610 TaxID=667725 RepID=A0A0L0G315_9EUKA|nr:hypothetical protein SARC_04226 [Sphaeroforma arctica JP610]KNC83522.1 hypothetical protein SARC_04226 [Sphaeroforma arctica JP610]|eukprot:XP_014157424.1 hypothetical protein SARC_04226 [Sphaeroforma arctica JP610]